MCVQVYLSANTRSAFCSVSGAGRGIGISLVQVLSSLITRDRPLTSPQIPSPIHHPPGQGPVTAFQPRLPGLNLPDATACCSARGRTLSSPPPIWPIDCVNPTPSPSPTCSRRLPLLSQRTDRALDSSVLVYGRSALRSEGRTGDSVARYSQLRDASSPSAAAGYLRPGAFALLGRTAPLPWRCPCADSVSSEV